MTVFDSNPEKKKAEFLKLYPVSLKASGIINWSIDFKSDGEIFNTGAVQNFDQIVFCKTSVQESLADIARIVKNQSKYLNKNQQFFIFTDKHDGIKDIASAKDLSNMGKNIISFGSFSQICSYDVIVNEIYDKMAIQADRRYNELHGYETSWNKLSPFLQDSNRMQVEHLPIKLKVVNALFDVNTSKQLYDKTKSEAELRWFMLDGKPVSDANKTGLWHSIDGAKILAEYLNLDDIEKIAKMEKNRWNAFHILNGWTTLLKPDGQNYPYRKNKDTKEHSCLVSWDELDKVSMDLKNNHNYKSDDVETVMRAYDMIISVHKDDKVLEDKDFIYCEEIFKFKKKIEELKKVDK